MFDTYLKNASQIWHDLWKKVKGPRMPWDENRRLKITLLRENPQKQNVVVEFEIAEAHRINFQKALEYLLAAFVNAEAFIKPFIETTDADTGKVTAVEIQVQGTHEKLIPLMNNSMNELRTYSVRAR